MKFKTMPTTDFDTNLTELRADVICAMQAHFERRRFTFDVGRFLANTQVDLDTFLAEAYFIGAEVFPVATTQD